MRRPDTLHRREIWVAARELVTANKWTVISIEEIVRLARLQKPDASDQSIYNSVNRLISDGLLTPAKTAGVYRVFR